MLDHTSRSHEGAQNYERGVVDLTEDFPGGVVSVLGVILSVKHIHAGEKSAASLHLKSNERSVRGPVPTAS